MTQAESFGFGSGSSASENGAAITAASQAAGPGGVVLLPTGTFDVVGAQLERDTTLRIPSGCTIVGDMTGHMIVNRVNGVGGVSMTAGSPIVTLNSTSNMRAGDLVAVTGAGPLFDGQRKVLYGKVVSIDSGTQLTLDANAVVSVSGSTLTYGVGDIRIEGGGTIDGNKAVDDGINYFPIRLGLARNCHISDLTIIDGDHGAVMFTEGCRDCSLTNTTMTNNGRAADELGSSVWVFQGGDNITIAGNTISGGWHGVTLDDRSSPNDEDDLVVTNCTVLNNTITDVAAAGVVVEGGSYNLIEANSIDGANEGVVVRTSTQGTSQFVTSVDNVIRNNDIASCALNGVRIQGVNTSVSGNVFTDCGTDIDDDE